MKQTSRARKFLFALIVLGGLSIGVSSFALELDWPSSPDGGIDLNNLTEGNKLPEMVAYFYEWGIAIGGLIAFGALVSAGFQYLTSVGSPAKMADAKDRITSAVLGLFLLLASFLILNVVNPELTALRMPELALPSEELEGIEVGEPEISKPCEKIIIYSESDFKGTSVERGPEETAEDLISLLGKEPSSIEFMGSCRAELYSTTDCSGSKPAEPMAVLQSNSPNLSALYLSKSVRCVWNRVEFTSAPCSTDCANCEDVSSCMLSSANCWWHADIYEECIDIDEACDWECGMCTNDLDCMFSPSPEGCSWNYMFGVCEPLGWE